MRIPLIFIRIIWPQNTYTLYFCSPVFLLCSSVGMPSKIDPTLEYDTEKGLPHASKEETKKRRREQDRIRKAQKRANATEEERKVQREKSRLQKRQKTNAATEEDRNKHREQNRLYKAKSRENASEDQRDMEKEQNKL